MAVSGSAQRQQDFYVPGSVGIGTTNPSKKLDVSGSIQIGYALPSGLNVLETSNNDGIQWDNDNRTVNILLDNNVNTTWDQATGRVGIGTTTPVDKLHVWGNITASDFYMPTPTSTVTSIYSLVWEDGYIKYTDATNAAISGGIWVTDLTDVWVNPSYTNVGIGTISPTKNLEIYGANSGILVDGAAGGTSARSGSLILHGARDTSGDQGEFGRVFFSNYDAGGAPGVAYAEINAQNVAGDAGAARLHFFTSDPAGTLTEAMVINEDQHVGIGISDAGTILVVSGSGNETVDIHGGTSAVLQMRNSNSEGIQIRYGVYSENLTFYGTSFGGSIMAIETDTGHIGIGTTNPAYKLDVRGSGSFEGPVGIGTTPYVATRLALHRDLTSTQGFTAIRFGDLDANHHGIMQYWDQGSDNAGYISFSGKGNTSGQLVVKGGGEVGIGTTNPSWDLHVHGTISASTYSRAINIPFVYGTAYDGHSPPVIVPAPCSKDEIRVKTISGSCQVRVYKNDTTLLSAEWVSASNSEWSSSTAPAGIDFVEDDYVRVHISESKGCIGLTVNVKLTY